MKTICFFCCEAVICGRCVACGRCPPDPKMEFFATPKSVTRTLLENEAFRGLTWEPACGNGAIAEMLPGEVVASDLGDYGFGESGVDFLKTWREVDNIVTNPPFSLKLAFKRHALECARQKVAMLFPIGTLGYELEAGTPLKAVYLFPPKVVKFVNADNGLRLAWHVWEKNYHGPIRIEKVVPVFPSRSAS
jgi:hypothetical protein